jgi:DNA-binding NarL/FixJ family response regulator
MSAPLPHRSLVLIGPPGCAAREAARQAAAGMPVETGFERLARLTRPAVRHGIVAGEADAVAAVLAAIAGYGLIVELRVDGAVRDRLLDDLRHAGPLEVRAVAAAPPDLDEASQALLRSIAAGETLSDAARRLGISRRTADRRLAAIRATLGVQRTVEAIAIAGRAGWLG